MTRSKGTKPALASELAHTHTVRPRQGGKRNAVLEVIQQAASAKPVHRVTPPMTAETRRAHYIAQNERRAGLPPGGGQGLPFTSAQLGRMRRGDPASRPYRAPRQHFARIDNQRRETGRVGAKRWGPQMSLAGLNQLLFRSRTSMKGVAGTGLAATVASQIGRQRARTGHGRRRQNRGSRRNG